MMKQLLVVSTLFAHVTLSHAESPDEKKFWKGQMDYLNLSLEAASKKCDVKFTFEWIDPSKLRAETAKTKQSPNSVCSSIIDEVERLCRDGDDERSAVKAQIKGFQCGHAESRKVELTKAGIVKYMGNNTQSNFSAWARPSLMRKL